MNRGKLGNSKFPPGQAGRLDPVCDRFEEAWRAGGSPRLEDFLLEAAEADRPALLRELLALELDYRGRRGERPVPEDYLQRFPELAETFGSTPFLAVAALAEPPQQIGRYRMDKLLGAGGFGRVYLAYDDQLHRPVAIKVPHPERILRPELAQAYLAEARVLASLDHPHIVPVYDVGTTPEGWCYFVSKLPEGCSLATQMQQAR